MTHLEQIRARLAQRPFEPAKHHASCRPHNITLVLLCDQCGDIEDAEVLEADLRRCVALIESLDTALEAARQVAMEALRLAGDAGVTVGMAQRLSVLGAALQRVQEGEEGR